ncbi:MAG: SPOR domain-containing protein [Spirochaetes bacterium]|nr:SPOR domain-containing protein [Spirochaetota bacterium]
MRIRKRLNLLLFFLIQFTLYAQTYSQFLEFERRGETQKALEILYKLIETTNPETEQYFSIIERIISLETDIPRILAAVEDRILKITNTAQKVRLLKRLVVLLELSGNIENLATYYEMIYQLNSSEENLIYLIKAAIIRLETGDIEKALSHAKYVESKAKKAVNLQRAILLTAYIDILKGNKDSALKKMNQILDGKYTEDVLFIIYKLSRWYDIRETRERSRNIIRRTHGQRVINELDIFQKPISPAFLFSISGKERSIASENQKTYFAYIQTGFFSSQRNAEIMQARIIGIGVPCKIIEVIRNGRKYFQVVVPVETERQIESYNQILRNNNIESFVIFNQ